MPEFWPMTTPEFLGATPIWVYQHVPAAVFVFAFGACVGSFLNVVIFRLPAGMSVISPPSRCPVCGRRLRVTENLPIFGWLGLRGKCRTCGVRISPQYMLVELLMACLFLFFYLMFYCVEPPFAGEAIRWWSLIGGPWWEKMEFLTVRRGVSGSWPAYFAFMFMIAGLFAMAVIDAKTFHIPIEIPLFVTFAAWGLYALQVTMPEHAYIVKYKLWMIPGVDWTWAGLAIGGMLGVGLSQTLLMKGVLRHSFLDYEEYVKGDEAIAEYPHARREMLREIVFLLPCIIGMIAGAWIGATMFAEAEAPPRLVTALGASFLGYLVGGGIIWGVRIVGSLLFGKEAMGIGDVHLLAAVGAVLGWKDPIMIFIIAIGVSVGWYVIAGLIGLLTKAPGRHVQFGPPLAVAAFLLVVARPVFERPFDHFFHDPIRLIIFGPDTAGDAEVPPLRDGRTPPRVG